MGHEVVDGGARLRLLQALIGRERAAECIHHSDLQENGMQSQPCRSQRSTTRLHTHTYTTGIQSETSLYLFVLSTG